MPFIKGNRLWDNSKTKETWFKKGHHPENEFQEGHISWLKGKKGYNLAENNPEWKGDNVGYIALHQWLRRHFEWSSECENCGRRKSLQLSNKTGQYTREKEDWWILCASCHQKYDHQRRKDGVKIKIPYRWKRKNPA